MRAIITEDKGLQHVINLEHVKMIEFTKNAIRIIWKDARQDALTIKAKQIIIE